MQLLFRALKIWALQVHVAKDNSILRDASQVFGNLSSSVSELLSASHGAVSTVYNQPDISQELRTLSEDKSIDNSTLAFYKQNLYEYEQGTAPAVVKGRLRAHLPF